MGYVAVKGGMEVIQAAEELVQDRAISPDAPVLTVQQILAQQRAIVDQAMGEGSLYAPELAALAVKQAEGDTMEAAFLLRAFRSTLPRIGDTLPADGGEMRIRRRVSSTFKDIPGGQVLGRTRDYTQRLLDFSLMDGCPTPPPPSPYCPKVARKGEKDAVRLRCFLRRRRSRRSRRGCGWMVCSRLSHAACPTASRSM